MEVSKDLRLLIDGMLDEYDRLYENRGKYRLGNKEIDFEATVFVKAVLKVIEEGKKKSI